MKPEIIRYIVEAGGRRVTSDEIKHHFGIPETTTGNLNTRSLIKEAMREVAILMGAPIGADGKGYFLIRTQSQLEDYLKNLQHRITGIEERMELVRNAWATGHPNVPTQKSLLGG